MQSNYEKTLSIFGYKGSFIYDVTTLGGGGKGFYDDSTKMQGIEMGGC